MGKENEHGERRDAERCRKRVGMHCSPLGGGKTQPVTLCNFSSRGMYFESERALDAGTWVVLRTIAKNDRFAAGWDADVPQYGVADADPVACMQFRSHTVARVQRCEKIGHRNTAARFGIGAQIQFLTE